MIIKFRNWQGSPRKDIANHSWFRLDNKIFMHEVWDALSGEQFKCMIYMMCCASINNKDGAFEYNVQNCARVSGISKHTFEQTIKILEQLQICVRERNVDVTSTCSTLHNTTLHNKHNNNAQTMTQPLPSVAEFDFEFLYQKYPRKIGKSRGLRICSSNINTDESYQLLSKSIENYSSYCSREKIEPRFIMHFSTFMNCWRDWLDEEAGSVKKQLTPEAEWEKQARLEGDPTNAIR